MMWKSVRLNHDTIRAVLMALGGFIIVAGVYLGSSAWAPHSLAWALGEAPKTVWESVNQALAWLWSRPLWGVIACGGLMVAMLGSAIEA